MSRDQQQILFSTNNHKFKTRVGRDDGAMTNDNRKRDAIHSATERDGNISLLGNEIKIDTKRMHNSIRDG